MTKRQSIIFAIPLIVLLFIIYKILIIYFTPSVTITYFTADHGIFNPGENISSYVKIKNTGWTEYNFWIEYSLQDINSKKYYERFEQIRLKPNEVSNLQNKTLKIPYYSYFDNLTLNYDINIYASNPLRKNTKILDSKTIKNAIQIPVYSEQFSDFNSNYWLKADYTFSSNRGYFKPDNATVTDGLLKMTLPANSYDGSGVESKNVYEYGSYSSRINCPVAPGTLCTFFLYQPTLNKQSDEVDIEIYNDNSRKVDFVGWVGGKKDNIQSTYLKFNPSIGFHQYVIDYYPSYLSFYADGKLMLKWTKNLPTHSMKIISNLWWPNWMNYPKLKNNENMFIDWITYKPFK